jgi:hypothetical protein
MHLAAFLSIHDPKEKILGVGIQPFVAPGPCSVLCASADLRASA